jgi:hypothetical protein
VLVGELPFAQDTTLPGRDLGDDERQEAHRVVGRENREPDHVADDDDHEHVLHRSAGLDRVAGELVAGHAVRELGERGSQPREPDGACSARRRGSFRGFSRGIVPDVPPIEAFGPSVAIGLILVIMLWFALGTQRNIRKGNELLRWLQGGLSILGRRTTLRWLGSSVVELGIVEPEAPFREATVAIVLEPRDVPLLWAFARSRGRRDFLIVRVNLARSPRFSMDVRDPSGWTGRPDQPDQAEDHRHAQDWPSGCVALVGQGADEATIQEAWSRLANASGGVWRLTVQPIVPHVEVHFRPPAREKAADGVLAPILELAATLARH